MKTHPDDVLRLQGIGPKAMTEINKLMDTLNSMIAAQQAAEAIAPVEEVPAEVVAPIEVTAPLETPTVEEAVAETEAAVQLVIEAAAETPAIEEEAAPVIEGEAIPVPAEEEVSFDELFTLKPGIIEPVAEEEDDESGDKNKKGKKKKKKFVELTYDPDRDVVLAKKKHKRGGAGWEWEE
jgi:N utilization substance protein A